MKLFVGILCSVVALIAYAMIEKRVGQRACAACGYRVSADAAGQACPRCAAPVNRPEQRRAAGLP